MTTDDTTAIKHHPVIGEAIIRPLKGLCDIARIIRSHHERYDGQGYPDRLTDEEIPLEARIIAIADSYDAMTTTRPYRVPLPNDTVIRELVENRGESSSTPTWWTVFSNCLNPHAIPSSASPLICLQET